MNKPMTKQELLSYIEKTWDAAQREAWGERFCDNNCTWLDHHPECDKAERPNSMRRTMDKDKVLAFAREAGGLPDPMVFIGAYERFAALVAAASEEKWKKAVIDELVCCHIYNAAHDTDPRKALHDAISWNVQVALDPLVSSDAQALIDRGAAAEREACAKVCESYIAEGIGREMAEAIRARGRA